MTMTTATETFPGIRRVEHVMGMPIVLDIRDDEVDEVVVEKMFEWLGWVDATFSTYKPDSEISRLNRGELLFEEAIGGVSHRRPPRGVALVTSAVRSFSRAAEVWLFTVPGLTPRSAAVSSTERPQ